MGSGWGGSARVFFHYRLLEAFAPVIAAPRTETIAPDVTGWETYREKPGTCMGELILSPFQLALGGQSGIGPGLGLIPGQWDL